MLKTSLVPLILLMLITGSISCTPAAQKSAHRPNIILIVVDTLRADHLSSYGYSKNTSPHIDQLVEEATLFKTCVTPFPRTTPSAVSILTGLYPHSHGTRSLFSKTTGFESLDNINLTEVLKENGYATGAFVNEPLLHKKSGIQQGFDTYYNTNEDHKVTSLSKSWLELVKKKNQDKPFFLMLWYMGSHWPYFPPPEDMKLFTDKELDLEDLMRRGSAPFSNHRRFNNIYTDEEMEFLISAYDGDVHAVDKTIGSFLQYLKQNGLYEDSLIVFTSDHGESLGEHDFYFEHGEYYYDVSALVPLIIKKPKQKEKKIFPYQVRTIDIFPTVLGLLDIDNISEGENLLPATPNEKLKSLLAFGENGLAIYWDDKHKPGETKMSETGSDKDLFQSFNKRRYIKGVAGKWRIARSNTGKLILIPHPKKNIFEFYDIVKDPYETNNLIKDPAYQTEIEYLKRELFNWIKPQDLKNTEQLTVDKIDKEMRKRLRSVGYLQ